MKILIAVKQVVDFNIRPMVMDDGSGVATTGLKKSMNPFDENALEEAVRLKEAGTASTVLAVSIGPEKVRDVLRQALALGADRALLVKSNSNITEPLTVAKLLKAVALEEQPDIIITGKQAVDDDACQTGQMLAGMLGWGQGTFVSAIELDGERAIVTREVDNGLQIVQLGLPAVLTAELSLNEPRYASLPDMMRARKQVIEEKPAESYGIDLSPRLQVLAVRDHPPRKPGVIVASVAELVGKLRQL